MRWGGLAAAVVFLSAAMVNLFVLPWGVLPRGTAAGWQVFGYAQGSFTVTELSPLARAYFDQAGRFLPAVVATMIVTVGARSGRGRIGGGVLALLGVLFAAVVAVTRKNWSDQVLAEKHVRWTVTAATGAVAVAVFVTLLLRLLRHSLPYDLLTVALLLALGLVHPYAVSALVSAPDNELPATILAWTPAPLYLLAALGAAIAARAAALRDRALPLARPPVADLRAEI